MLDDELMPDEIRDADGEMVQHLRYLYDSKAENAQALARIRARLLNKSEGALPVADALEMPVQEDGEWTPPEHVKPHKMRLMHNAWTQTHTIHTWSRRLTQLVAVLLVALITGAFAIVLTLNHINVGGSGFPLRPGWREVAVYKGTGSVTQTHLNRTLPRMWTSVITCNGTGIVNIDLLGASNQSGAGTDSCQSPMLTLPQPIAFEFLYVNYDLPPEGINTIKATADAKTSWQLHILEATQQPTFKLGTEWNSLGESMSDNGIAFGRDSQHNEWSQSSNSPVSMQVGGQNTIARTWGIITVCFGSGQSHATLDPDVGNIPLPACNGQPKMTLVRFPASTAVQMLTMYSSGDIVWNVGIVACVDEAKCQQEPAIQVTPVVSPQTGG